MFCTSFESPLGTLWLVSDGEALTGLYFQRNKTVESASEMLGTKEKQFFQNVQTQLTEYFEGKRTSFEILLKFHGTPFQQKVWQALLDIPFGETRSYSEQAEVVGCPEAIRAVGTANGLNPISIIVPCHRVIGKNGRLTGYAGGLDMKKKLLSLEMMRNGLFV